MQFIGAFAVAAFTALVFLAVSPAVSTQAFAQATCRNKCNEAEQACLRRTGNKSQCGTRAQACATKCR
ncbi:MAG: hypothetical protein FJX29_06385 [Alphaproteobacteria bacterium]|nr:hypothetical protein [Alphaproteobacteria bacterium]